MKRVCRQITRTFAVFILSVSTGFFAFGQTDSSDKVNQASPGTASTSQSSQTAPADSTSAETSQSSSQTAAASQTTSGTEKGQTASGSSQSKSRSFSKAGESDVPPSKAPKTPDSGKVTDLDNTDPDGREKNADILKFGLESEISDLLDKMTEKKDVRFVNEAYTLYENSKSEVIKNKVMLFFEKIEDPCLEDYAVIVLNDPYDEKISTVNACFSYIQAVKTTAAIPAVEKLLEDENPDYFNGAVSALGKIGGSDEALYLADYFERQELTDAQKQTLVRVLGELKAQETYDKLVELAKDEDENSFVRMYAAEAIGAMEKAEAVDVLAELYGDRDPNFRSYVIRGLSHFSSESAKKVILEATRDDHWKVRKEAIAAIKNQKITEGVDYLVYRAKNDPERTIKNQCYPVIAELNVEAGNKYLLSQITEKKVSDDTRSRVAGALLANGKVGTSEIIALAEETLKDDRRKQLRYALGKEFAKYSNPEFGEVCLHYLEHKDVSTVGTGLDMYAKGRYSQCDAFVKDLADKADPEAKKRNAMAFKAAKILGIDTSKIEKKSDSDNKSDSINKSDAK